MAVSTANKAVPFVFTEMATLSVADGKALQTIPFVCQILGAFMSVGSTGGTSGNTDVVLEYTAPSDAALSSSGDLWTVGSGVGRIAYNASTKYIEWSSSSFNKVYLEAGGTLKLNVDAIPSTASNNLLVILWVHPVND